MSAPRFFPDPAARLDLRQVTFLEQETATDVGRSRRRVLDVVAQVRTTSGNLELILRTGTERRSSGSAIGGCGCGR